MGLTESGSTQETEPREETEEFVTSGVFDSIPCPGYPSHRIRYNSRTKYSTCVRCQVTNHPSGIKRFLALRTSTNMSNRDRIITRDGFKGCRYCGLIMKLTLEHLDSYHAGGKTEVENLGLSCGQCNNLKGPMTEKEFLDWLLLGKIPKRIPIDAQLGLHRQEAKRRTAAAGFMELLEMLRYEGCFLHSALHSPEVIDETAC